MNDLVGTVNAALADLGEPDTAPGSPAAEDYLALRGLLDRLEVVGLRWLAALDASGVGAADGSVSTAAWVRRHAGRSARVAAADVRLARRLHTDQVRPLATTRELLEQGRLSVEHARVLARATATLTPAAFELAEPTVATAAAGLPVDAAGQVATQVARHAEDLHANAQVDPAAARRAAADAGRHLHLSPCGEMYALDALLTAETGQALQAVLEPLSQPRPQGDALPDLRSAPQRRADALGEAAHLLLRSDRLPVHGGQRPQLTVLVDLDDLASGRHGGSFPDGTPLSPQATARIGCDARTTWIATRSGDNRPEARPPARPTTAMRPVSRRAAAPTSTPSAPWSGPRFAASPPPSADSPPRSSTPAAPDASSPPPNAAPSPPATAAASSPAATAHPNGATPTT